MLGHEEGVCRGCVMRAKCGVACITSKAKC